MYTVLFMILITYLIYKHAVRSMMHARLMNQENSEKIAYTLFMVAGTCLGQLFVISLFSEYIPILSMQIAAGTISSIFIGESFYHYNKRLVRRIPSIQERKNY
jgi:sRNA-binding regulator protein Hfq